MIDARDEIRAVPGQLAAHARIGLDQRRERFFVTRGVFQDLAKCKARRDVIDPRPCADVAAMQPFKFSGFLRREPQGLDVDQSPPGGTAARMARENLAQAARGGLGLAEENQRVGEQYTGARIVRFERDGAFKRETCILGGAVTELAAAQINPGGDGLRSECANALQSGQGTQAIAGLQQGSTELVMNVGIIGALQQHLLKSRNRIVRSASRVQRSGVSVRAAIGRCRGRAHRRPTRVPDSCNALRSGSSRSP